LIIGGSLDSTPVNFCYWKNAAFFPMKLCHLAGTSESKKIADTGQAGSQAAQSVQAVGSMYIWFSCGSP